MATWAAIRQRRYRKRWAAKHPDKVRACRKKWRESNKERILDYQRRWRAARKLASSQGERGDLR